MYRGLKKRRSIRKVLYWKYGLMVCGGVCIIILGLWEQACVSRLDSTIRKLNLTIEDLRDQNSRLRVDVLSQAESGAIAKRAEEELNMIYPDEENLVILHRTGKPVQPKQSTLARHALTYSGPDDHEKSVF
jgi:cell division protein FtsL